jgi:hypothetical protein
MEITQLEVTRVIYSREGVVVAAKHPEWSIEFTILFAHGRAQGRTSTGSWVELSEPTTEILRRKSYAYVRRNSIPNTDEETAHLPGNGRADIVGPNRIAEYSE